MDGVIPHVSVHEYRYHLPKTHIPDRPLGSRDQSRLLVYQKEEISEHTFSQLPDFIQADTLMVFNNSKVILARLYFRTPTDALVEVFCLHPIGEPEMEGAGHSQNWKCIIGNSKRWKQDVTLHLQEEGIVLKAEWKEKGEGENTVKFTWEGKSSFFEVLEKFGEIPLPPYMHRHADHLDKTTYQTVYASALGSVAAPTAGLHFTEPVLGALRAKKVSTAQVTLHVGAGTFKPVKAEVVAEHTMHEEFFEIEVAFLRSLMHHPCVIAVGTTSMRTLESLYHMGCQLLEGKNEFHVSQWSGFRHANIKKEQALGAVLAFMEEKKLQKLKGSTSIMIVPGYTFRICTGLVTNFHQPESSLILLVAAFVGPNWRKIYDYAVKNDFRFLSYGDSSLLLP
jgi:S-adenosylmethionine:tRNA ribosyltransferase-isomerase